MIKPYLPFHDFFISSLCLGLVFAFGLLTPINIVLELPTSAMVVLYVATIILVIVGMYQLLFVVPKVTISSSIWILLLLSPIFFVVAFPELAMWAMGSWVFESDKVKYFNAYFALVVAGISFCWSWWDTHIQLQRYKEQPNDPLKLMTFDVFLSNYSFEVKEESRGVWMLSIPIALAGVVMLCLFVIPTLSINITDLRLLLVKSAAMLVAGIFFGLIFISMGQFFHLIQQERKSGHMFQIRDFEERLRWRHDYVKYHLPAPLRKLNLRFFNQHVEAYERLQNEVKSSRT
jgi:hypothetical protein